MKFKPAIRKLRGAICSAMGKKLEEFKSEYSTWGVMLEVLPKARRVRMGGHPERKTH
jgi:hypothetical protein